MRRIPGILATVAVLGLSSALVTPRPAAAVAPEGAVSWQSAGDSYSSGEGVFGNVGDCAQSSDAYGPLTVAALRAEGWQIQPVTFTACTGHLVEDYFNPRQDSGEKQSLWDWGREQGGPARVDVITMSFGGNDIGFAQLLVDCLDLPARWYDIGGLAPSGCDPSEADLDARVDALLDPPRRCSGTRRSGAAGYDCDLDIGDRRGSIVDFYYDVVSQRLTDRGRLYVVGYPRIFAPVAQWPGWVKTACQGVYRGDTERLSRLADHLNAKLGEAVARANRALGSDRVVYVDRLAMYSDGSHELCGSGDDWLNGLAANRGQGLGIRKETSFHPNAAGHAGVARGLAGVVSLPKASTSRLVPSGALAVAQSWLERYIPGWSWVGDCNALPPTPTTAKGACFGAETVTPTRVVGYIGEANTDNDFGRLSIASTSSTWQLAGSIQGSLFLEAPTDLSPPKLIADFLEAWSRGLPLTTFATPEALTGIATLDGLTGFRETPANWSHYAFHVSQGSSCPATTTGTAICGFALVSPQGGGLAWDASIRRNGSRLEIVSFKWLGGGA